MNYKRTWTKKFGKSEIYKRENSGCQKVEIDMLRLADGEQKSYRESDKEYALVILGGKCDVKGESFEFLNTGKRKNVFDGAATCIYVPANTPFTIKALGEVQICLCHGGNSCMNALEFHKSSERLKYIKGLRKNIMPKLPLHVRWLIWGLRLMSCRSVLPAKSLRRKYMLPAEFQVRFSIPADLKMPVPLLRLTRIKMHGFLSLRILELSANFKTFNAYNHKKRRISPLLYVKISSQLFL